MALVHAETTGKLQLEEFPEGYILHIEENNWINVRLGLSQLLDPKILEKKKEPKKRYWARRPRWRSEEEAGKLFV